MESSKPQFAIVFVLFFVTVLCNSKTIFKQDLNLACCEELQNVQGIGKTRANAIIKERENGMYVSFQDLDMRNDKIGKVLTPRLAENFTIK